MARLYVLSFLLISLPPLFAITCYEEGTTATCGGKFCGTQTEVDIASGFTTSFKFCGERACQTSGCYDSNDRTHNYKTCCCTGDYCNSSGNLRILGVISVTIVLRLFV